MKRRTPLNLEPLESKALLSGLSYSLTTNQASYQPGQPVVMTFRETNVSSQPISVEEGPSIDGFDVSQNGVVVWRSNTGILPMFIASESLQPGQSLTLSASWNGMAVGSTSPLQGTFVISNQLNPSVTTTVSVSNAPSPPTTTPPTNNPQPIGVAPSPQSPTSTPISQDPNPSSPTTATPASPIAVSVTANGSTVRKGHGVRMTITLKDVSNAPVTLPGRSAAEFTLLEGTTPIWHRATSASSVRPRTLQPGRSAALSVVWNGQASAPGVPLVARTYTVEASDGGYSGSTTLQLTE
jgi:hypothetical protein